MSNLTYSTGPGTCTGNLTLCIDPNLCTLQTCDLSLASFDYLPSVPGNALIAAIFGVCIVTQLILGIGKKTFGYMVAMFLGLLAEIIGYVARILLNSSPFDNNNFIMYLTCLTIAPALISASIYLCLARIVHVYGENLSRFKPRTYTIVFCTCDFICLVLQGTGGGIASTANTLSGVTAGKNIMLAGLIIQVISLTLFAAASAEFALRVSKSRGSWNVKYDYVTSSKLFKAFLLGLATSTLTIFIRSVYRCAELAGGFNSTLFRSDQAMFMILEGAMIAIAVICLTVFHPAIAFRGAWHEANFHLRSKNDKENMLESTDMDSQMSNSQVRLGEMRREAVEIGKVKAVTAAGQRYGQ